MATARPQVEWDAGKARTNYQKHRVSFEEAATVFVDPWSITMSDPDHSEYEQRFIDIGMSNRGRLLVVVYPERSDKLRIISGRRATLAEQSNYEQSNN